MLRHPSSTKKLPGGRSTVAVSTPTIEGVLSSVAAIEAGVSRLPSHGRGRRVLMLVENLSVPLDRRVWQEAVSLREAGYQVTIICPRGNERDSDYYEARSAIEIHRYDATPASGSASSYIREYAVALWRISRLARKLARDQKFDVVHVSNPPDLLLLAALPLRRRGVKLIFDHHDLVPELLQVRFGTSTGMFLRIAKAFERVSFTLADIVISPNESFKRIAVDRGRKPPDDVFVVRNAPDLRRFRSGRAKASLKRGRAHLIAYVGVMAPQDGVDHALRALAKLRERRDDWHAVFVGDGDSLLELQRLAGDLGLADHVEFRGFLRDEGIREVLSTADVCLAPEPRNALNDASTMIKIAEYMAMARPIVCFDLKESRLTAGGAALYARPNDDDSFAESIDALLSNASLRARLGSIGQQRVEKALSWQHSEAALLAAYDVCLRPSTRVAAASAAYIEGSTRA